MKTLVHIVGTRPNFIKAAPIINAAKSYNNILIHTGQHYDSNMSTIFFDELNIPNPDYYLNVSRSSPTAQISDIMSQCESIFDQIQPDHILVYGDVNSTLAAAIVANKMGISLIHIESGLRSYDKTMPEEINRIIVDSISDVLMLTSREAFGNLRSENIVHDKCYFIGNTMIDTLVSLQHKFDKSNVLHKLNLQSKQYILFTLHRPSNVDNKQSLNEIVNSIIKLSSKYKCIFPIHPRTQTNLQKYNLLDKLLETDNIVVIQPQGYFDFMCLQKNAKLVVTDSGGVQEETSYFNVPCLTMRDNTERPVTVTHGTNILLGSDFSQLVDAVEKHKTSGISNIELWDGNSAERIIKILDSLT